MIVIAVSKGRTDQCRESTPKDANMRAASTNIRSPLQYPSARSAEPFVPRLTDRVPASSSARPASLVLFGRPAPKKAIAMVVKTGVNA